MRRAASRVDKNKVVDRSGCAAELGGKGKDAPAVMRGPCHVTVRWWRGRTSGGNPNFRNAPAAPRRVPGLAAMRKLNWDLLQLQKGSRDGSHATRRDRSYVLARAADTLHELGFRGLRATGLKRKHVNALVAEWQRRGLTAGTIKNRTAHLRWWAKRIDRPGVVPANGELGIANREYVTNADRRAVLDPEKLARVKNPHVAMALLDETRRLVGGGALIPPELVGVDLGAILGTFEVAELRSQCIDRAVEAVDLGVEEVDEAPQERLLSRARTRVHPPRMRFHARERAYLQRLGNGRGLGSALRGRILEERAPDGIRAGAGEGLAASAVRKAQSSVGPVPAR